ncbi:autotransporter outer membrane beta-barrel domain-containing protein [Allorhizobium taibaishanense]|uniref:Autotransporter outer membrane beta-barrel domain-containing protein n=1 Tax=Allorhizobium taibaishanense TaxID=887144 RepID=A0A1Q9A836_9HYPH|nr:autotransporter domain-containing protein [Allorhizobium taibaishanense]MBB4008196.1 uncharacterized protein with beta-barrel porin domain [Allorhizobium taibaishanense]OLP50716.1 autotransporter outer membrane beta-barrel domain-containing protein [Allorhizobium taibaishanense]
MKPLFPVICRGLCLLTALVPVVSPTNGLAQSAWTGTADNEFSNTSNWTPSAPTAGDAASVDTGSPQVTNDVTVRELNVGGGNVTVTNTGILTTKERTTISSGSVSVNAGGVVNSNVDLNGGNLSIDGDINGRLRLESGNVTVNGTLDSAVVGTSTALSNNGAVDEVNVSTGGTFVNNSGASAGAVTNAGAASNAGTMGSLNNTAGSFTNNSGGTVTGKTTISGGTVTNNFVITDADVAAAAVFSNNSGATAGVVRNSGTVTNAGTIASLQNDAGTVTNNVGGTVTGTTTVGGGSVVNNATLADVNVTVGGTFVNNSGASAGAVTNAGTASNAGAIGSLNNTAGNFTNNSGGTVTGKTTISGGTVTNNFVITDADVAAAAVFSNNSGATAGAVRNSGTVTNAGTIASLQNDAGTVTNNSGGTVTGTTTVGGGSVVNNATLADVNVGASGNLVNNSNAVAGTVTNSGIASNDGTIAALVNKGGTFANTGTITGTAIVSGGSLINEGSIDGTVNVDDGGLLSGPGSVEGLFVNAGGLLSPGPGIATTVVNGALTFRPGSIYQVDIDTTGRSDAVNVTGAVSIEGGTLDIKAASGNYVPTTSYKILSAGSITGAFDSVSSDFAFLSPTLSYGANAIDMHLMRNGVQFADIASTTNGRATAAAVEVLGSGNPVYDTVLSLDSTTANGAFSQLSGEVHASLKSALLWESRFGREAVLDEAAWRLDRHSDEVKVWSSGFAASNRWSGNGNAAAIDTRAAGVVSGIDVPIYDEWRLGGLVGYSHDAFAQANTDSYHAGLYAMGTVGPINLTGGAIYSHNVSSTLRNISFGTLTGHLTAEYGSATKQVFADFSWPSTTGPIELQPFVTIAYVGLDTDKFRERTGDASLSAAVNSDAIATSTMGLRWSMDWAQNEIPMAISGMLGWRHIAGDLTPYSRMTFAGGSSFVTQGVTMPQDSLLAKLSVSAKLSKSARLTLSYSGEFGKGLKSSAAQVNVTSSF